MSGSIFIVVGKNCSVTHDKLNVGYLMLSALKNTLIVCS